MTNVSIGVTSKRINSTSQSMSSTVSLGCRFKEPCSMHDPVFIVQGLSKLVRYNFASWNGAYYWIDDIVYTTNNIQEVHCHLDPLATFKSAIEDTNALIVYGDSTHRTSYIDDIRFGPDHKLAWTAGQGPTGSLDIGIDRTHWTFVMTVQSTAGGFDAGIISYAMEWSTLKVVLNDATQEIYSDASAWSTSPNPTLYDVMQWLTNWAARVLSGGQQALDNIRSLICVPVKFSDFTAIFGSQRNISIGPYNFLAPGDVCVIDPTSTKTGNAVFQLGRPLPNLANPWLNSPKYCSIKVTHPGGYEEINDPSLMEVNQVFFWWSFNIGSGEYAIRVTSENSKDSDTIALITGNVGIDVLNMVTPTAYGLVQGPLGFATGGFAHTVLEPFGLFNQGTSNPKSGGSSVPSGFASLFLLSPGKEIFYDVEYYQPAIFEGNDATMYNAYCAEYGYPVGKWYRVGDISGFVQCSQASIGSIAGATEADKSTINGYLKNGLYIE